MYHVHQPDEVIRIRSAGATEQTHQRNQSVMFIAYRNKGPIMDTKIMDTKSRWSRRPNKARRFSVTIVLSIFVLTIFWLDVSLAAQQLAPAIPMQPKHNNHAEFR